MCVCVCLCLFHFFYLYFVSLQFFFLFSFLCLGSFFFLLSSLTLWFCFFVLWCAMCSVVVVAGFISFSHISVSRIYSSCKSYVAERARSSVHWFVWLVDRLVDSTKAMKNEQKHSKCFRIDGKNYKCLITRIM